MFRIRREVALPWKHRRGGAQGRIFWNVHSSTVQRRGCPGPLVSLVQEVSPSLCGSSFAPAAWSLSSPWSFEFWCVLTIITRGACQANTCIWSSWSLPYCKLLNQHSDFINPHLESFVIMSQPARLINPSILGPKMVSQGPILYLSVFIKVNAIFYNEVYACQPFSGSTPHAFLWVSFFGWGNRKYSENCKQEGVWLRELGLFKLWKGLRIRF